MRLRGQAAAGRQAAPLGRSARDPVLTLQRSAGNRATARLLQRQPSNASRLAAIAKRLRADEVVRAGIEERDIHLALRVKEGKDDGVRPGLNIVNNLPTRGRTGFVDADGRYRGDFLTPTRDGALPAVAIMLGPQPFTEGDDSVLATLRHELAHAEHDQTIVGWLGRWRGAGRGGDFAAWMRRQKVSAVDLALVRAGTAGSGVVTELLAHIEGFAAALDKTPAPTAPVVLKSSLPLAIEELRGAAEHGWTGVDEAVKTAAAKRLADYYQGLDAARQSLLRDWLFYLRYRAGTPWPKDATDDEARAARFVRQSFQPHLAFLDWMLGIIRGLESSAHRLPSPSDQQPVSARPLPKAARTVAVGRGKVRAYVDVGFEFRDDSRSHGISLGYEGPDAREMRWLQFIWREVVPDHGRPVEGRLYHQQESYPLTTNPSEPSQVGWNTDTATYIKGSQSAFYELDNAANRSARKLEIFDEPSAPSPRTSRRRSPLSPRATASPDERTSSSTWSRARRCCSGPSSSTSTGSPSPVRRRARGRGSSRRARRPPSIPVRALACTRSSKTSTTCRDRAGPYRTTRTRAVGGSDTSPRRGSRRPPARAPGHRRQRRGHPSAAQGSPAADAPPRGHGHPDRHAPAPHDRARVHRVRRRAAPAHQRTGGGRPTRRAGRERSTLHLGVAPAEIGRPIAVDVRLPVPTTNEAADIEGRARQLAALPAGERRGIDEMADWDYSRKLGVRGAPRPTQGPAAELWKRTRDEILRDRNRLDSLPPEIRAIVMPGGRRPDGEYGDALALAARLEEFTWDDWALFQRRVGNPEADLRTTKAKVDTFSRQRAGERATLERIRGTERLYDLLVRFNVARNEGGMKPEQYKRFPGYDAMLAGLAAAGFRGIADYENALARYFLLFEARASEIALEALAASERAVQEEIVRYRDRGALARLFDDLAPVARPAHR